MEEMENLSSLALFSSNRTWLYSLGNKLFYRDIFRKLHLFLIQTYFYLDKSHKNLHFLF